MRYQIRIQGHLDPDRAEWFGELSLCVDSEATIIEGDLLDQAALYGLLAKLRDLGLTLIEVHLSPPADS